MVDKKVLRFLPVLVILIGFAVLGWALLVPADGGNVFGDKFLYSGTFNLGFDIFGNTLINVQDEQYEKVAFCPFGSSQTFAILGAGSGKHIYVNVDGQRVQDFGAWETGIFGTYTKDFGVCLSEGQHNVKFEVRGSQNELVGQFSRSVPL